MRNIALWALLAPFLAACASTKEVLVPVKVAVPVPCEVAVPERPVMPTERLRPGATLDAFVQASAAEIERREAYEGELRAALEACAGPLSPDAPPGEEVAG